MKELERIQVGKFNIKDALTIQELKENVNNKEFLKMHIISIENLFKTSSAICLENKQLELFLNGVKLHKELQNDIYRIYDKKSKFIGLGQMKNNLLKRDIIL
ncbi:MAG: hypothetical protein HFJ53_05890 [Clostridia bacterium]|jgi:tRNA U55 pseudouridine synthase TruB|nr:hypothetical protein [Clostridia bacterium]